MQIITAATVLSPTTLMEVRQRSMNQSRVSTTDISVAVCKGSYWMSAACMICTKTETFLRESDDLDVKFDAKSLVFPAKVF